MIAQFSLRLICGMSLMWSFMPRRQVTSGFFRIQMLVVLGLSILCALTIGQIFDERSANEFLLSPAAGISCAAGLAVVAFLGSILWTLECRRAGTVCVLLVATGSAMLLLMATIPAESFGRLIAGLLVLSELSTAAMLGSTVTGMLLGHWYLTAPTMSTTPLDRLNLYVGLSAIGRLVLSGIGLILAWDQLATGTVWLWLSLRWTAGIAGPLLAAVMVWRILKYRNTQSATGVLFVAVVLVFIGALSASLLRTEIPIPL